VPLKACARAYCRTVRVSPWPCASATVQRGVLAARQRMVPTSGRRFMRGSARDFVLSGAYDRAGVWSARGLVPGALRWSHQSHLRRYELSHTEASHVITSAVEPAAVAACSIIRSASTCTRTRSPSRSCPSARRNGWCSKMTALTAIGATASESSVNLSLHFFSCAAVTKRKPSYGQGNGT
jgi:hypothetical protein